VVACGGPLVTFGSGADLSVFLLPAILLGPFLISSYAFSWLQWRYDRMVHALRTAALSLALPEPGDEGRKPVPPALALRAPPRPRLMGPIQEEILVFGGTGWILLRQVVTWAQPVPPPGSHSQSWSIAVS